MSILEKWQESMSGAACFGTIRCPRNYIVKPGRNPFKIMINPRLKDMTDSNINYLNKELMDMKLIKSPLKKWIYARDRKGNKIQDFRNFDQPLVSKAYVIKHIYNETNPICSLQCKKRCFRGMGRLHQ